MFPQAATDAKRRNVIGKAKIKIYMKILENSRDFRNLIRKNIGGILENNSFILKFDNSLENQEITKNWIFKLVYKRDKIIEIYNEDWRDYVEYFFVSVDGKELFYVKINDYETLAEALDFLKLKILQLIE
ncbi:MAG: hypothetical protein CFE21_22125 [Bacteroidetes bacterium B1(2017)]|nr:MAG: hypothetical protein CFE21_22125 [Bacteroidetes bacterium B1(2017)]